LLFARDDLADERSSSVFEAFDTLFFVAISFNVILIISGRDSTDEHHTGLFVEIFLQNSEEASAERLRRLRCVADKVRGVCD
jgi:hypothetical protein